jgi:hypothetical protein
MEEENNHFADEQLEATTERKIFETEVLLQLF